MENTRYANNAFTHGYWLETTNSSDPYKAWYIDTYLRRLDSQESTKRTDFNGVRPAIEVPLMQIEK